MAGFHDHLVLNRWLLSLFHQSDLAGLKSRLHDAEGVAPDGHSRFFHALTGVLFFDDNTPLTLAGLRRYDMNVVTHWQAITARRNAAAEQELQMKYFQYLSLLFGEIYLDWYFHRRDELIAALNQAMAHYRRQKYAQDLQDYCAADLNKVAFWNATGSGKTLLMHVNLLQYRHYAPQPPDKVLVLTPNEGLSRQHVDELRLSGFQAALFDKNTSGGLFGHEVEVIDVNKLADKHGDKTVAVAAFAGNNLVLVDEGHRGASGTEWLARREALIDRGFAFEYSATLGQAAGKDSKKTVARAEDDIRKKKALLHFGAAKQADLSKEQKSQIAALPLTPQEQQRARQTAVFETYAKAVLFDYSYKFFYADGYGKDSLILNMDDAAYAGHDKLYFTACLLAFYQQLYLFERHEQALAPWHIEKPLMVFVGNTVSGENSDVLAVVRHLAFFLNEPQQVQRWLADLVQDKAQIVDAQGRSIFAGRFTPLMAFAGRADALYADMLRQLFHAPAPARLRLTHLSKTDGELALSLGSHGQAFAVINIGKPADLLKAAADDHTFDQDSDAFSGSLFHMINHAKSPINLLIGSKKFTEGWSSWRVSTMGLLNMGKSEGSQIIQLFGRGVRLKGRDFSLKRSLPLERPPGLHLEKLETLNIFGVRARYMAQFKEYLKEEGITPSDEILTLDFPVQPQLPAVPLKTLRLKDGYQDHQKLGFKRTQNVWLYEVPPQWQGKIKPIRAVLDAYPRVEALSTQKTVHDGAADARQTHTLDSRVFAWFDWDAVYLQLLDFKLKHSWNNLRLDKARLRAFAEQNDWYTLYAPASALQTDSFADIRRQQNWLTELLQDYTEQFYQRLKAAYEGQFYETVAVDRHNASLLDSYRFEIDGNSDGLAYHARLQELKTLVESGNLKALLGWEAPNIEAICFDAHLYYPIMVLHERDRLPLTMKPLAMQEGSEIRFVRDLQAAHLAGSLHEMTGGKDVYLLRNAANKAKGLGFALAGNFYPDFLLWLVDTAGGRQWLTFVDPKGIRNMGVDDPKFGLAEEVKKLGRDMGLQDLVLNSVILSVSRQEDLINSHLVHDDDWRAKNIVFMDAPEGYLKALFDLILTESAA